MTLQVSFKKIPNYSKDCTHCINLIKIINLFKEESFYNGAFNWIQPEFVLMGIMFILLLINLGNNICFTIE
tara:strand:+ start:52 stop:264 length:213 start_codon:yes stop_codon:yes gene_type:complete